MKVDTKEGSKTIMSDSVILSVGYKEENTLYNNLQFDIPDLYLLGDAKKYPTSCMQSGMHSK